MQGSSKQNVHFMFLSYSITSKTYFERNKIKLPIGAEQLTNDAVRQTGRKRKREERQEILYAIPLKYTEQKKYVLETGKCPLKTVEFHQPKMSE